MPWQRIKPYLSNYHPMFVFMSYFVSFFLFLHIFWVSLVSRLHNFTYNFASQRTMKRVQKGQKECKITQGHKKRCTMNIKNTQELKRKRLCVPLSRSCILFCLFCIPMQSPRHSRQISGTFQIDFGDVLGRFQGFSGQISGIFQAYIFSLDNHGN
jgi:hypothetical protein